jgi:hypothetical protein
MSGADEKMRAVLERSAKDFVEHFLCVPEATFYKESVRVTQELLERRLLPLLLSGQAMRDSDACAPDFDKAWDAALAAAQGQPEKGK